MPASSTHKELSRALKAAILLQCVGYALFTPLLFSSPFVSVLAAAGVASDAALLADAIAFFAASGVSCIAVCLLDRNGVRVLSRPLLCACYAVLVVCTALTCMFDAWGMGVLPAALAGLAIGVPLLYWFDSFYHVYKEGGAALCLGVLAIVTMLPRVTGALLETTYDSPVVFVACVAVGSAAALVCQLRLCELGGASLTINRSGAEGGAKPEAYRLSLYIAATIASFGVTNGLLRGMSVSMAQGVSDAVNWTSPLVCVLACAFALGYAALHRKANTTQFGLLIRLALCFSGVAYALMPLVGPRWPGLMLALVSGVGFVHGIAMTLISVEIAHERGMSIVAVMPVNYLVYVAVGSVAMAVPQVAVDTLSTSDAWSLIGAVAVIAAALVLPALPSVTSTAATFALKQLPENQNYEDRTAQARAGVVAKYGLSPREGEVLGLLVKGMTRAQIAEELSLSSWTVKEYVAGVYSKVGVHSAKELMVLVANGEGK